MSTVVSLPTQPWSAAGDDHAPRVAVVGADGFIGRHLATALGASGARVTSYTRQHELSWPDDGHAPGLVFYLASSVTPALAELHPEWVTADHLRFAELIRRLARFASPPTVVLTSSAGTVYDADAPGPCREDTPTQPACRYGEAKLALERVLLTHADRLPSVVLRLANVYGPGQRVDKSQGVLGHWLAAARDGQPLQVIGDTNATRDYVYIHDVVDCMLRVANRTYAGATQPLILNVASGVSTSLGDLLSTVEQVIGRPLARERRPGRPIDRRNTRIDIRYAARTLGWRPSTPLAEGIRVMWAGLDPHRESPSTVAGVGAGRL